MEACDNPAERAVRAAFLRQIETRPVLEISNYTASAFGLLAASVKKAGRSPRPRYNDLWIATQAIEHGYMFLTIDPDDFRDLPGLRVISFSSWQLTWCAASPTVQAGEDIKNVYLGRKKFRSGRIVFSVSINQETVPYISEIRSFE